MSSKPYAQTVPLPPATLAALRHVYHARGLSQRSLASSIGTTHPHVGRIIAGVSRPSVILAERIGLALDLPAEFTAVMMDQSSTVGRKMRHPDGFAEDIAPIGDPLCPVEAAQGYALMHPAIAEVSPYLAAEFNVQYRLNAIGLMPAMGGPIVVSGMALDPWSEFNEGGVLLLAWRGPPDAPASVPAMPTPSLAEFIASVPAGAVIRCAHHGRQRRPT